MTWPAIRNNVMTARQWFIGCALLALAVAALVVTRFWFWSSDFDLWKKHNKPSRSS